MGVLAMCIVLALVAVPRPGWSLVEETPTPSGGRSGVAPIKALQLMGFVQVLSKPNGLGVEIDGGPVGVKTPTMAEVTAGEHTIAVVLGRERFEKKVEVSVGGTEKVEFDLDAMRAQAKAQAEAAARAQVEAAAKAQAEATAKAQAKAAAKAQAEAAAKTQAEAAAKAQAEAAAKAQAEAEWAAGAAEAAALGLEMAAVRGGLYECEVPIIGNNGKHQTHTVRLSDFLIGRYEMTQALWVEVMGKNPSRFKGPRRPVENVSWFDVQEFIRKLNSKTGKRYRLPTDAEWQYAARSGGLQERYAGMSSNGDLTLYAWFKENSGGETHPVGRKQPNGLGLYDMSGNVWEWCADWDQDWMSYAPEEGVVDNPTGPATGTYRVIRGGSWSNDDTSVDTSPGITDTRPGIRDDDIGFRLVISR